MINNPGARKNVEPPVSIVKLLEKYLRFLDSPSRKSRVVLCYHTDLDGASSAVSAKLLLAATRENTRIQLFPIQTHEFDFSKLREKVFAPNTDEFYLCLDLNITSSADFFEKTKVLSSDRFVVVDDHKVITGSPKPQNYLNPNFGEQAEDLGFAPSLFTYLAASMRGLEIPGWLPALGLIADKQFDLNSRYIHSALPPLEELSKAVVLLSSPYLIGDFKGQDDVVFSLLCDHVKRRSDWNDFFKAVLLDGLIARSRDQVDTAVSANVAGFLEEIKNDGRPTIVFNQIGSEKVTNIIASTIRNYTPYSIVVVVRNEREAEYLELRAGTEVGKVNIPRVLKHISKKVKLRNFGGHPRAAGCAVSKQHAGALIKALEPLTLEDWSASESR